MNKKIITLIVFLTITGLFIANNSRGLSDNDDPKSKYAKVLKNVCVMIEEAHFKPKKIDDVFSRDILKKFTADLDDEKSIFIQSDIEAFKKYATVIDDEIHGRELESFFAINNIYLKRLNEASLIYPQILSKPFDFSKDEKIQLDPEKLNYPASSYERVEVWRRKLKYLVLGRYVDMLEDRDKNKDQKDFVFKADSTLERECRDQVRKQMDRYFTTKKNRETQDENFSTFVNALTSMMDPHTDYFPPVDLRSFNENMSGRFYGIGAQLKEDDGRIIITSLVTGGPAWKSGELKENDEIIKVAEGEAEPVDVTGYAVSDAVKLIRGTNGSVVKLTIKRMDGTIKTISLIREKVNTEEIFAKSAIINSGDNKIGYIYLPEFYADFEMSNGARCAADVAKEIEKLKQENVKGIILDLRGNGGGSLYDVVQMAGLFINSGPICQVKGRDENPEVLPDRDPSILYDGPLEVMVDGTSASASEIFAAAIQDYKRGLIIGGKSTFGKGTVQRNIPLSGKFDLFSSDNSNDDLGSIKLTMQKFYRINGGATQLRGVTPDIVLPERYDYLKFREKDNKYALGWDEIPKASYSLWHASPSMYDLIPSIKEDVFKNKKFDSIRNNIKWLEKYLNKEYSLNIVKYKEEQKQFKLINKQMDELMKLSYSLNFINLASDTTKINSASDKIEKNKQWLKARVNDIYIDEAVMVMNKMIIQAKK